jgi:hypothetical protein
MSWKAEVVTDDSGKWASNALRFATEAEAIGYAKNLHARWTLVREYRATECDDPVTSTWDEARPDPEPLPRAPDGGGLKVEVVENIGQLLRRVLPEPGMGSVEQERPDDHEIVVAIQRLLDGVEWTPDTLDQIAAILVSARYQVRRLWP